MSQKKVVDLRSDTVTLPTKEMREAMRNAELGDDVFREDPTVNKLEKIAAEQVGMENALLVTSGTQGNITALTCHTERGEEVILEEKSHIYNYEVGAMAVIADLLPRPLRGKRGLLQPSQVRQVIREEDVHAPNTGLLCLENTHNMAGGVAFSPEQIAKVSAVADKYNFPVHLDGARIFNAAITLDRDVKEFTKHVDSLMVCLSKGLSAPVGSILAGSESFIEKARKVRKMLGGGMRQAGIIAAPGIIALEKMVERLEHDHKNAQLLAEELKQLPGIAINMRRVQTNIVIADVGGLAATPQEFSQQMEKEGIKFLPLSTYPSHIRFVTHRGITEEDIRYTIQKIRERVE